MSSTKVRLSLTNDEADSLVRAGSSAQHDVLFLKPLAMVGFVVRDSVSVHPLLPYFGGRLSSAPLISAWVPSQGVCKRPSANGARWGPEASAPCQMAEYADMPLELSSRAHKKGQIKPSSILCDFCGRFCHQMDLFIDRRWKERFYYLDNTTPTVYFEMKWYLSGQEKIT